MAIVILPLLPVGPYGPFGGIKPRELWLLVLFFTGLSFAGYLARRMCGARNAYPIAGLLAGMVSSTTATFTFARHSRRDPDSSGPLAVGTVGACTMLYPRVLAATLVLDPRVAIAVLPYLAAPFVVGMIALAIWWRVTPQATPQAQMANPLQVGPALQMAVTFQVVLLGVSVIRGLFGTAGLLASGAALGLTDVDALTISMAKSAAAGIAPRIAAALAIGIGR